MIGLRNSVSDTLVLAVAPAQAHPAPARPADRLHDPADHVRAAVRLRLRRRDPDAGLRLRRLPDAGHHRPEHRVRRVRHRARAGRRPRARASSTASARCRCRARRSHRPHARRRGHELVLARACSSRRHARRASRSTRRCPRSSPASLLLLLFGYAFSWVFASIGLSSSSPEAATRSASRDLPADVHLVGVRPGRVDAGGARVRSPRSTRSRRWSTRCARLWLGDAGRQ